jgi:hypothetical protein
MTAVTHPQHAFYTRPGGHCTFCRRPALPPYVEWICYGGADDEEYEDLILAICANCCRNLKRALLPDMVRVIAFDDFRCASPPARELLQ